MVGRYSHRALFAVGARLGGRASLFQFVAAVHLAHEHASDRALPEASTIFGFREAGPPFTSTSVVTSHA